MDIITSLTIVAVFMVLLIASKYWLQSIVTTSQISDTKLFVIWMILVFGSLAVALSIGMTPILIWQYHQGMPLPQGVYFLLLMLSVIIIPVLLINIAFFYFYPTHYIVTLKEAPNNTPYGLAEAFLVLYALENYLNIFERLGIPLSLTKALVPTFLFLWFALLIWRHVKEKNPRN